MVRRHGEIFGSVSVWLSKLSVHSRTAFGMRPLGCVSAGLPALLWWPTGGARPTSLPSRARAHCPLRLGSLHSWEELCLLGMCQGSGFCIVGLCPCWQELGWVSTHQQGGPARGKEWGQSREKFPVCSWALRGEVRPQRAQEGKSLMWKTGFLVLCVTQVMTSDVLWHMVSRFPGTVWGNCPFLLVCSCPDFHELTDHVHLRLFLGSLFRSPSPCVCVSASFSLLWLLQLRDTV